MGQLPKVIISEVKPPIPTTDFDFCAFFEGEEERQEYGWGATPDQALSDLYNQFETGFYTRPNPVLSQIAMADILRQMRALIARDGSK